MLQRAAVGRAHEDHTLALGPDRRLQSTPPLHPTRLSCCPAVQDLRDPLVQPRRLDHHPTGQMLFNLLDEFLAEREGPASTP